jgi:hypothetical protein
MNKKLFPRIYNSRPAISRRVLKTKLTPDHSFQYLTIPRKETTDKFTENEETRAELAEVTLALHRPLILRICSSLFCNVCAKHNIPSNVTWSFSN